MSAPFISMNVGGIKQVVNLMGAQLQRVMDATKQAMGEIANDLVSEAQARIQNGSGDLSRSGTVEDLVIEGDELVQRFGFNSVHGRQTDQGGTIKAKNGRNLAIPLDPILTSRGVSKYTGPRAEPDLFPLKLWGKLFLARKMGKTDRTIQLHWLLVPSVTQEGNRFFTGVVDANKGDIPRRMADRISGILSGGPA